MVILCWSCTIVPPTYFIAKCICELFNVLVRDLSGWPEWLWWRPHGRKKVLPQGLACCTYLPRRQWRFCRQAVTRLAWLRLSSPPCSHKTPDFEMLQIFHGSSWPIPKESPKTTSNARQVAKASGLQCGDWLFTSRRLTLQCLRRSAKLTRCQHCSRGAMDVDWARLRGNRLGSIVG